MTEQDESTRSLPRVKIEKSAGQDYSDGWIDGFYAGQLLGPHGVRVGHELPTGRARRFGGWLAANWSNIMITAAAVSVAAVVILSYTGRTIR